MTEFWQQCVNHLSQGLSPAIIKQWIMPLSPIGFNEDETEFHIAAPSPLKQNWAQRYYAPTIQALIKEQFNHDVAVVVLINKNVPAETAQTVVATTPVVEAAPSVTKSTTSKRKTAEPVSQAVPTETYEEEGISVVIEEDTDNLPPTQPIIEAPLSAPQLSAEMDSVGSAEPNISQGVLHISDAQRELYQATHLNPNLTFANLVVGHSNELAEATAKNVVRNLGRQGYNPLFLYGSTGLGKTHLMHAIGNELFKEGKVKHARYIHANDYYTEISAKMRDGDWVEYRLKEAQKYAQLDLLLIDDIQFFKNKERTQQEFFHLYEALVSRGKQVVICSDTYPRELKDIEERLISRFNSGMTIQIEPPELEMRVAILQKKAENHPYVELSDDAAFFIAKHIRSNVRELEGGLQKVIAFAQFRRMREITVDICKEALKDLLRVANGLITVENIQKTVADFYKIRVADIYSKSRKADIVRIRHVAMYLAKELTRKSLPELGQAFGGRDHSTIHHAVEKVIKLRATDRELNHDLHVLEQTLKG
ncbi:MAG: chromosomal replication initiator protein DnaA [Pelistega sp.]|nr:chromosomal replication initiator protein DnaA [Pelistega sp.]